MVGTSTFEAARAAASARSRDDVRSAALSFAGLGLQVLAIIAVATKLDIANPMFVRTLPTVAVAFAVHYWLPQRLRMPFFVLVSLGSLTFVLGFASDGWDPSVALLRTTVTLLVGFGLIAVHRLPMSFAARVAILVGAAGALALWRIECTAHSVLAGVWPVLGSMFMFRLILYSYEVENEADTPSTWRTLAYFFMLPNACFPLYPVVDWRSFGRDYYNDEAVRIYQTGLRWIVRGFIHCIGYELILLYLYWEAERVANGEQLARYLFANSGLYLRVSGHFHIVTGVLHLFGWNLAETNRRYFLADSFTDYWRRVNVYWKELMVTLFYNPVAYRLRRTNAVRAVLLGSVTAFVATWFLHGYQAFWLTGSFRFSLVDAIFWAVLGVLVIVNANREARRPRTRRLVRTVELRSSIVSSVRTAGVFATLCVLWSLWSCGSWSTWMELWRYCDWTFWMWTLLVLFGVALCKLVEETAGPLLQQLLPGRLRGDDGRPRPWLIGLFSCALPLGLLWLGRETLSDLTRSRSPAPSVRRTPPGAFEYGTGRGYYEDLIELSVPR